MVDHPMQNDALHQVLKGMIDELIAFKEYRVRAYLVDDNETASVYDDIAYEEVEHIGEFLKLALELDPKFKEHLLMGMRENKSKPTPEVEDEIEEVSE